MFDYNIKPKYNLGDRINDCVIVGIIAPDISQFSSPDKDPINIYKEDKNWRSKWTYIIKYDNPIKPMTIEDFQNIYPDREYVDIEAMYASCPFFTYLSMIESSLDKKTKEVKNGQAD